MKSNTVLLFQGFRWKKKIQRAKPLQRTPKINSVTNRGGSTLLSSVPLKKHCISNNVIPLWPQMKKLPPVRTAVTQQMVRNETNGVCGFCIYTFIGSMWVLPVMRC